MTPGQIIDLEGANIIVVGYKTTAREIAAIIN
jgi:hypothetical protein